MGRTNASPDPTCYPAHPTHAPMCTPPGAVLCPWRRCGLLATMVTQAGFICALRRRSSPGCPRDCPHTRPPLFCCALLTHGAARALEQGCPSRSALHHTLTCATHTPQLSAHQIFRRALVVAQWPCTHTHEACKETLCEHSGACAGARARTLCWTAGGRCSAAARARTPQRAYSHLWGYHAASAPSVLPNTGHTFCTTLVAARLTLGCSGAGGQRPPPSS